MCAFADDVSAFYAACAPKQPAAEDAAGFRKVQAEWARRRGEVGPQESSAATMEDWAAMPGFRRIEHEEAYA